MLIVHNDMKKDYLSQDFDIGNKNVQTHSVWCDVCKVNHEHVADPTLLMNNEIVSLLRESARSLQYLASVIQEYESKSLGLLNNIKNDIAIMAEPAKKMKDLKQ